MPKEVAPNSSDNKEKKEGEVIVTEKLTVFRGSNPDYEFDGGWFYYDYDRAEKEGEVPKSEYGGRPSLNRLAEEMADSIIYGRQNHLQSDVDPQHGVYVEFENKDSEQAKLFGEMVSKKVKEVTGEGY